MNRFYNKKSLINLAVVFVGIIAILTVLKLNISTGNTYYEFQLKSEDSNLEQVPIDLQIKTPAEDDVIPINRNLKAYVLGNKVKFPIENRALTNESMLLQMDQNINVRTVKVNAITVLEKNGEQFTKKGTLSSADDLAGITYTKQGILIDKKVSDQLSELANQNWKIKLFLCVAIVGLVVCFLFFKKNKYTYASVFLFFVIASFFVLNSQNRYFFGKDYYYNYSEKKERILVPNQQFEQQFTVPKNNFASVDFQLTFPQKETEADRSHEAPELLLQLIDKQTNKVVDEKYVFYPKATSAPVKVSLSDTESKKLEKGTSYQVIIKNISSDGQEVSLPVVDESSEVIGKSSDPADQLALTLLFNKYPIKIVGMGIIVLTVIAYLLMYVVSNRRQYKTYVIVGLYLIGLLIFGIQVKVEQDTIEGVWDPDAHISFIASLEATNTNILPDYRNQLMMESTYGASAKKIDASGDLSGTIELVDEKINYQGHPPLYHQILRLFGDVKKVDDRHITMNFTKLLTISNIIAALSILIWFVIGFLYIKKEPIYHWLYVTLITSSSILIYGSSQLGNDVIGLLALGLTVFGLFGLSKKQYTVLNYVAVALGIGIGLLTKVNVGAVVVITALLFLIQKLLKKEYKILFNWKFLLTVPLYLLPIYFYLKMYAVYGVFMQSFANIAPAQFYNGYFYINAIDRPPYKSLGEFIYWFYRSLLGFYTFQPLADDQGLLVSICQNIAQLSLVAYFFACLIKVKSWGDKWMILRYTSFASCIFLLNLYLNTYNRYYLDGYLGGVQGRYFLYAVPVIALGLTWAVQSIIDKQQKLQMLALDREQRKVEKPKLSHIQLTVLFLFATTMLYSGFLFPYIFK